MTNFIFKSQGTYKKLCQQLVIILNEQRAQRMDLVLIKNMLTRLINDKKLQKQVDDYFDETSHQTESDEHFEDKPGDIKWSTEQQPE